MKFHINPEIVLKGIIILIMGCIVWCFVGCSAKWHVNRAIKKDPSIQSTVEHVDTLTLTKTVVDTIHTSDSTYYVEVKEMTYDTVVKFMYQKYDFSEMKTWFETWQENQTERKKIKNDRKENQTEIRQKNKTDRTEIRQDAKTERGRSWWWLWLAIGLLLSFLLKLGWKWVKPYINANK